MTTLPKIHNVSELWTVIVRVWNDGLNGMAVAQLILAALLLAAAVAVRRLVSAAVLDHVRLRFHHRNVTLDDTVIHALTPPVRFLPIVAATFIIAGFLPGDQHFHALFAQVNRSLVVFALFWALVEIAGPMLRTLHGRAAFFTHAMIGWAARALRIVLSILGVATVLEIWGIHVGPMLAGLGLVGVAVALGAQDLFKNLIAGIFIIGEQRFKNGDWILAENVVEGLVESIGLRTTKVRRFDMAPVYVPNAKLADNPVINFAQMTYRRISWILGLEYGATVEQLRAVRDGIEAYILAQADFVHPPDAPIFVRIDRFNDSSIDMMVYCFTRTTDWAAWLKIKEALALAIKDIVEREGCGFAFPSQSLYVESVPAGTEPFPLHAAAAPANAAPASGTGAAT